MKFILIFGIILFSLLISSCSRIDCYRYYNNCVQGEKGVYVCQCDSGSFSMFIGWTQNFRMMGLPFIPLVPTIIGGSHNISVYIYPEYDSLYNYSQIPKFALRPLHTNELIKYNWADTGWTDKKLIYTIRNCFDISGYSPDTLDVVFLDNYLGCKLPIVTFIATKETEYVPFEIPLNQ